MGVGKVPIAFNQNDKIRLGVEIELQIVDPQTGDLTTAAAELLSAVRAERARLKSEIFQSMLEIDTPICEDAIQVGESLRESLSLARAIAQKRGVELMMSGTHPYARYTDRQLSNHSRYHTLVDRNQWIARRLQIFGLHVHLGMRDGNHAIWMNNALCHYLPLVLSLSASSPFWHSNDTGLASSRITFFEAIPTGGHPVLFDDWSGFETLIGRLMHSKSITSLKDLWWDIRPNPEFGTIEVRIADCPPTIREVEAIVALIHSLALYIDEEIRAGKRYSPPPEWILRENKWRASRHGVNAEFITNVEGNSLPLAELWTQMKAFMKPHNEALGYQKFFDFAEELIQKGPSSARQRAVYEANGQDLRAVVNHLVRENQNDQPEW